jgi:hypothetical protein
MERVVPCPACGHPVKLGPHELSNKAAGCGTCKSSFELLPEMFIGDELMRRFGNMGGAPDAPSPPRVVALDDDEAMRLLIRNRRPRTEGDTWSIVSFSAGVVGAIAIPLAALGGVGSTGVMILAAVSAILLLAGARTIGFFQRDVVRLDGDGITVRRTLSAGKPEHVPFERIDAVRVTIGGPVKQGAHAFGRVKVVRRGQEPLLIAEGMAHDDDTLAWVAATLERKLRRLRLKAAQAHPAHPALPPAGRPALPPRQG